jgi:hypothetical protein
MQVSAHFERLRGGYKELCKIGILLLQEEENTRDTTKIMAGRILWENFLSGTPAKSEMRIKTQSPRGGHGTRV